VFFLYVFDLSNSLNPTPLDTELLDIADRLYNEMAVDIAKVVTQLGALPTVIVLVLVTSIVLAERRRWAEIAVLVGGLALIYMSVNVTKGALDRPRPANPLVDTSFASFPSGHAAYAVAWIAVALVLTRRLGLITNAAVLLVAVAIAAVVGLTRIYLRAHYWSDVAAGWGLGCGIFAALTAIVLVVEYMRHNGRQREQGPPAPPLAPVER
jgi:membrane-associated phospholipid phosphatase